MRYILIAGGYKPNEDYQYSIQYLDALKLFVMSLVNRDFAILIQHNTASIAPTR